MRQAYAHDAVLRPVAGTDTGAPDAAITTALRGHGTPHHTAATAEGDQLHLRILFATAPDHVDDVRARIDAALAAGDWQLVGSGCTRIVAEDREHARRLLKSR
jgi:hypothetical protein